MTPKRADHLLQLAHHLQEGTADMVCDMHKRKVAKDEESSTQDAKGVDIGCAGARGPAQHLRCHVGHSAGRLCRGMRAGCAGDRAGRLVWLQLAQPKVGYLGHKPTCVRLMFMHMQHLI